MTDSYLPEINDSRNESPMLFHQLSYKDEDLFIYSFVKTTCCFLCGFFFLFVLSVPQRWSWRRLRITLLCFDDSLGRLSWHCLRFFSCEVVSLGSWSSLGHSWFHIFLHRVVKKLCCFFLRTARAGSCLHLVIVHTRGPGPSHRDAAQELKFLTNQQVSHHGDQHLKSPLRDKDTFLSIKAPLN